MFFDIENSGDSIYDFFYVQQDYNKKFLKINLTFVADYYYYISKKLQAIKSLGDNKCDMLTNKNSKFLFYQFNDLLDRMLLPVQRIRHKIIAKDKKDY